MKQGSLEVTAILPVSIGTLATESCAKLYTDIQIL